MKSLAVRSASVLLLLLLVAFCDDRVIISAVSAAEDGSKRVSQNSAGGKIGRRSKPISGESASTSRESVEKNKSTSQKAKRKLKPSKKGKTKKRNASVKGLVLPKGRYNSRGRGLVFSCTASGSCVGRYSGTGDNQPARVIGKISKGGILSGYWVEVASNQRCSKKRYGSFYWGKIYFKFNTARTAWSGSSSYCGARPNSSWNGSK